jgi:hypothetical protein
MLRYTLLRLLSESYHLDFGRASSQNSAQCLEFVPPISCLFDIQFLSVYVLHPVFQNSMYKLP